MIRLFGVCLAMLIAAGCTKVTVTTPPASGLPRPDRLIVHGFGVAAPAGEHPDGRALAAALTDSLIKSLRDHGVDAVHVNATSLPGPTTASLLGEIVPSQESREIRTRIQVYQGAGRDTRLVAEMETSTPSVLPQGAGLLPATATVDVDARRTADAVADRIGEYYRLQAWPWR